MAHELGDDVTEARLRAHVEERCEPRTFGDENDRFGFFFGWGEPYPRGQHSALLMLPEVGGRGAWSRWSSDANLAKFARRPSRASTTRRSGCRSRATTSSAASC
jgi:hypothetical protein